jgi:hypothetical protein
MLPISRTSSDLWTGSFGPVVFMPLHLRRTTVVSAYRTQLSAINLEDVR